jgi:3-oxoacyl-[acyl-carrier-protein] synthase-3
MTQKAAITGTGSAAPERVLSNKDFEQIVDTSDEWITRRTGIKERHISSTNRKESASDLSCQAANNAMEMAGISPEDLDMIVVGTITPDQQTPSTACMIQDAMGAKNAYGFDVSAGCTGFIYALSTVRNAIMTGTCRKALVVGVDRLSAILNWQDRGTCVLLGDGAGAVVVESTENNNHILSTHLKSNGGEWDLLYSTYGNSRQPNIMDDLELKPFYLIMDGNRLFKRAVNCMASIAMEAISHNNLTSEDIALIVPHQANMRIIQATAEKINVSMEKVYTNLDRYGNTSAGSIPIALDEANRKGMLKKGDYVLFVAFGAGLTWGSSLVRWHMS